MRITLTLDDGIAESIERFRARENLSRREAVNKLLRAGIFATTLPVTSKPYTIPTFQVGEVNPKYAGRSFNQILDELDVDEFRW